MCILCVIQKWSRRVANMLPWLVIPLVGLWALSQLLPPAFRFEITSTRLSCVFVLLLTLFWYEVLVPLLSSWRVRRNAQLWKRKRVEAIELQKLRKTATRRCRNCLNEYRDQNPGGGRYMCSYCGHISKRPVLDLPVPPGLGMSNSGIIKDLVGKGGKILNTKTWSDTGWMCGQDWLDNNNWVDGSFASKSSYGAGYFVGDAYCSAETSYSGIFILACKLLSSFFLSIRWLWTTVFRDSSSEDVSGDVDHRGLSRRGGNGMDFHESRCEKARRKAEEKRQARLDKEVLEEEERKQREEVARLVEERRRLRDENMEPDTRSSRSLPVREKVSKKEAEKKSQERSLEKDNASSKSNSDAEELERKAVKESDAKREGTKNTEVELRENKKTETEIPKFQNMKMGYGRRNISSRENGGTRYLDRMRGTFFPSSKAFSGNKIVREDAIKAATFTKENKSNNCVEHIHTASDKTDLCVPERVAGKSSINEDHKFHCSVLTEQQSKVAPKKSWQQLFTGKATDPPSSKENVISTPSAKLQAEVHNPPLCKVSSTQSFDNSITFGLPMPFTTTNPNGPNSSSLGSSPLVESMFPCVGGPHEFVPEELDRFEDPCYVPDPISLLGPVSESLDNFQMDIGTGFSTERGMERNRCLKNVSAFSDGNRPSPIEPPLSRSRVERPSSFNLFPPTPEVQDTRSLTVEDADANNKGTWQMWNTSPLGRDGLGLIGGLASLTLPQETKGSKSEDFVHPPSHETTASLLTQEDHMFPSTLYPEKVFLSSAPNGDTFFPVNSSSDHDPWLQNPFFPALSGSESINSLKPQQDEMIFGSHDRFAINHPFEQSLANYQSKKDWDVQGSLEGTGRSAVSKPHVSGLFPTSDVQSFWQYNK